MLLRIHQHLKNFVRGRTSDGYFLLDRADLRTWWHSCRRMVVPADVVARLAIAQLVVEAGADRGVGDDRY